MKENRKYIGENIRAARKSRNITISTLSELAEISESFLGTVERGESSISIETLINLCKALNVTSDSIIMDVEIPYDSETNSVIDEKKAAIMDMLKYASENELDFLMNFIRLYRGKMKF